MDQMEAIWIKEERIEIHTEPDSVAFEDPLMIDEHSLHIKEDPELTICADGSERKALEDSLMIEEHSLHIKDDPELKICGDGSGHNVVPSTTCASNSTRLMKNSAECCGISSEKTINQGVINEGLNEDDEEESTHSIMFVTCTKGSTSQEEISVGDKALSADSKEKFPCSDDHKNIKFSKGDVEVSSVEQMERQSSSQETSVASQKSFSVTHNTQTAIHNAVILDSYYNYLISPTTNVSAELEIPCKCDVCGRCFTRLGDLNRHALIHSGIKTHKCDNCGKSFTRLIHLKNHALKHSGIKPYKCDTCGKPFTVLDNLKRHKLIHSGIKPHKCDTCGKYFTHLSDLKKHALIHSGMKPHKCDTCGKSFTHLEGLKLHALRHSGIKPHKCRICGKSFTHLSDLKKHALIHSGINPHKCDTCGKSFNQLFTLKTHVLIHSGLKPHQCDTCGKSFTRLSSLKRHVLIHFTIKPKM